MRETIHKRGLRWAIGTAVAASILACSWQPLRAENWPQWRGAQNDGVSHETSLPTHWSKTENVAWRLPLPGPAGATPVVWQDPIRE